MAGAVIQLVRPANAWEQAWRSDADPWSRTELVGRLVELSGQGASAALTLAFGVVAQAQRAGEPTAWINATLACFYPPDAAAGGVDLGALVVVQVTGAESAGRAADKLLRSGAFGAVVLDLGKRTALSMGLQARLVKLAQKHAAVVICLTDKAEHHPSLSSLVSLRCIAERTRAGPEDAGFMCGVRVLKDKRRGPGWSHEEFCRGPPGVR